MTENFQTGLSAPDSEALSLNPENSELPEGIRFKLDEKDNTSSSEHGTDVSLDDPTPTEASTTEGSPTEPPAPEGEASPLKPKLPDGIGLKLEELAALLSEKHGTTVNPDDPVLMTASICNAFLGELVKLHQSHNEALGQTITFRTQKFLDKVKGHIKDLNPQLPDGIGMRLEELVTLLSMKHGTSLTLDDPILMIGSICNSHLGEIQELQKRHNEALSQIIASRTQEYVSEVKTTSDSFARAVSTASVEGIRKIFMEHADTLQSHTWNARWCALITAAGALANLIALAAR